MDWDVDKDEFKLHMMAIGVGFATIFAVVLFIGAMVFLQTMPIVVLVLKWVIGIVAGGVVVWFIGIFVMAVTNSVHIQRMYEREHERDIREWQESKRKSQEQE